MMLTRPLGMLLEPVAASLVGCVRGELTIRLLEAGRFLPSQCRMDGWMQRWLKYAHCTALAMHRGNWLAYDQ